MLCCIGAGICFEAYANRKRPKTTSVYLEKKMTVKGPRSVMPPINAVLSPDGNTITLYSPENCDRAFVTISGNGTYLTEMVMVLNHKIWQWYKKNILLAKLYNQLYDMAAEYAENNLKGEELDYYYRITD